MRIRCDALLVIELMGLMMSAAAAANMVPLN
jgi:hypothetical protein